MNERKNLLKIIGSYCRKRRIEQGYKLSDVTISTGYANSNVLRFERGENDNLLIFLWYLNTGIITIEDLRKEINKYGS